MAAEFEKLLGKTQKDTLLGCLYLAGPSAVGAIKDLLVKEGVINKNGYRNISSVLKTAKDANGTSCAVLKNGKNWQLTQAGEKYVNDKFGFNRKQQQISQEIDTVLSSLDKSSPNYEYVTEFAGCFDSKFYRASLVMAWSGAIWLLREHIEQKHLKEFNAAAKKEHANWKPISKAADFENHKDATLLKYGRASGALSKSLANRLEKILDGRNNCGHPSEARIGEVEILGHIEFLVKNVYAKY